MPQGPPTPFPDRRRASRRVPWSRSRPCTKNYRTRLPARPLKPCSIITLSPSQASNPGGHLVGALERDDLGGGGIGGERAQQLIVKRVAGFVRTEGSEQRPAEQVQVADGVEDLVADEFVTEAQPLAVQHAVIVHDDGVLQAAAQREADVAQILDVVHEAV